MSDENPDVDETAGADEAGAASSPDASSPTTFRDDATDRTDGNNSSSSKTASRPASGAPLSARPRRVTTQAIDEAALAAAPASEASRAAAAEAQAAVLKDGGANGLPAAPVGLLSFAASMSANGTMFGLGAAPVVQQHVKLVSVPRLDDLVIKAMADNYHLCPAFDWIPPEYLDNVVGLLQPGKLDFASSCALVESEKYWCRLARERWNPQNLNLANHGQSWKRLYCEKHIKETMEKYSHSKQQHNYLRLLKEVEACKPFVHTLQLSELLSHLDLSDLLFDFPHLSHLDLKFGARDLGMDYDKSLFGMTLSDSVSLSKLLCHSSSINRLNLSENLLGDEGVLLLMAGLHPSANRTLTSLDLSHNKIGDIGARKLAQLLDGSTGGTSASNVANNNNGMDGLGFGTVLTELNLSDNHIRSAGGIAFGAALSNNRGLRSLNLSLNGLGDEGGIGLFNGCTQHTSLRILIVSSCELLSETSGEALLNLLRFNRSLETINVSCNSGMFGALPVNVATGSAALLDALKQNEQIVALDMRRNGITPRVEEEMKTILSKRLAIVKQAARRAFQRDWDAAM